MTIADYQAEIGDSVRNGAAFQAVLLEFELLLQHGQASLQCPTAPAIPRCYAMRELIGAPNALLGCGGQRYAAKDQCRDGNDPPFFLHDARRITPEAS